MLKFHISDGEQLPVRIAGKADSGSLPNRAVHTVTTDHVASMDRPPAALGVGDGDRAAWKIVNHREHAHRPVHDPAQGVKPLLEVVLGLTLRNKQQIGVRAVTRPEGGPVHPPPQAPRYRRADQTALLGTPLADTFLENRARRCRQHDTRTDLTSSQ